MESAQQMVYHSVWCDTFLLRSSWLTARAEISRLSLGGQGPESGLPPPIISSPGIVAIDITQRFAEAAKSMCLTLSSSLV
jgi:hypothetical protein